ncbi:Spc98 family-domain-containing protein [Cantharellus anzutake]|uniref:Spc98 family-domain-containing protein n=1 Tax=Cantharellus anzutake TaxID=1750568 RepID=UPI00190586C4|nr:Spc98 family-domain-containing protein [Cantharellus anzutake]KAF8342595.1 Spc98 family-domain-containing protein [Cantharellus anzutake]
MLLSLIPVNDTTYGFPSASEAQESSFIEEASFVQNPLNSRLGPRPTGGRTKGTSRKDALGDMPLEIQEALILEDLLFVLMGIPGTYITHVSDYLVESESIKGGKFVIANDLDASLRDLVERILPLATYYMSIASFMELRSHTDYGLVNHALCAAIRDMLKDYLTLVSQLEHAFVSSSTFSLQKMWFYVHPTLHSLSIIYALITELGRIEESEKGGSDEDEDDEEEDPEQAALNREMGLSNLKDVIKAMMADESGGIVKGGEVVTIVWERMRNNSGDPTAFQVYRTLLHRCSLPYTQMIRTWSTTGFLRDPYDELMVKESKSINRGMLEMDYIDEYWEKRYTLRDGTTASGEKRAQAGVPKPRAATNRLPGGACMPPLLEPWKHKILQSGKYLNVIREYGVDIHSANGCNEDDWVLDEEKFYKGIEDAYTYANRTLLKLVIEDQELLPRLRAMKNYFFLSQSSFLVHFLELAALELRKPSKSAPIVKLQSLLDLSLNMNFSGEEVAYKYKDDVRITLATSGLYDWLHRVINSSGVGGLSSSEDGEGGELVAGANGSATEDVERKKERDKDKDKKLTIVDTIALDFTVPFPLSLVISRKTILRYQLLFRFLLHLKHVEQSLMTMWIDHKSDAWKNPAEAWHPDFARWKRRVMLLRARMIATIQQLVSYVGGEVLDRNWATLEGKLNTVATVDQLLRDHVDYLDTCLKECMLTNARCLKTISHLLQTCYTFSQYSPMFNKQTQQVYDTCLAEQKNGNEFDIEEDRATMEKRWAFFAKFEQNFNHVFKVHLDTVQFLASSENTALLALVVRLNNIRSS